MGLTNVQKLFINDIDDIDDFSFYIRKTLKYFKNHCKDNKNIGARIERIYKNKNNN